MSKKQSGFNCYQQLKCYKSYFKPCASVCTMRGCSNKGKIVPGESSCTGTLNGKLPCRTWYFSCALCSKVTNSRRRHDHFCDTCKQDQPRRHKCRHQQPQEPAQPPAQDLVRETVVQVQLLSSAKDVKTMNKQQFIDCRNYFIEMANRHSLLCSKYYGLQPCKCQDCRDQEIESMWRS